MNKSAVATFKKARKLYEQRDFSAAQQAMADYLSTVDYQQFGGWDNRASKPARPLWSVIVVTYGTGDELLKCLDSILNQQYTSFEIILVNNGWLETAAATKSNEVIANALRQYPILCIEPDDNLLPSEGRNIGAWAARGEYLAFIDDDGIIPDDYLHQGTLALAHYKTLGARGKVIPKTANGHSKPHYDLGTQPQPSELTLEGNMVFRRRVYNAIGGFDPLMFGHEGKEFTWRCQQQYPDHELLYWPDLILQHDYAEGAKLETKKERQATGWKYLEFVKEKGLETSYVLPENKPEKNNNEQSTTYNKTLSLVIKNSDAEKTRDFIHTVKGALNSSVKEIVVLFDQHKAIEPIMSDSLCVRYVRFANESLWLSADARAKKLNTLKGDAKAWVHSVQDDTAQHVISVYSEWQKEAKPTAVTTERDFELMTGRETVE